LGKSQVVKTARLLEWEDKTWVRYTIAAAVTAEHIVLSQKQHEIAVEFEHQKIRAAKADGTASATIRFNLAVSLQPLIRHVQLSKFPQDDKFKKIETAIDSVSSPSLKLQVYHLALGLFDADTSGLLKILHFRACRVARCRRR
jgi:hypothetical protein